MSRVFAQGDVLLVAVADIEPKTFQVVKGVEDVVVLAEGEHTGHRHAFYGGVVLFRNEALARDYPADLYVGHVKISPPGASLQHGPGPHARGDHDSLEIPAGTYVVLRQREYDAGEAEQARPVYD